MKIVICGSRTLGAVDRRFITAWLDTIWNEHFNISEVVSGGARGADRIGEVWAKSVHLPVKQFIPDWSKGRGAGFRRNIQMVDYADGVIALWDGKSKGTKHTIDYARSKGKTVVIGYFSGLNGTWSGYSVL